MYLTKDQKELRNVFLRFKALVELETDLKIKVVRCDNAPEYRSLGTDMLAEHGIKFEYTTPYTAYQNGVSERLNRTLVQIARSMLHSAGLPLYLWGEAIDTACYIRNRTLVGLGGLTPEEAYSGKRPYVGHLRTFRYVAYVQEPLDTRDKLKPTATKTALIGYMSARRMYRLFKPASRSILVSTSPRFKEGRKLDYP